MIIQAISMERIVEDGDINGIIKAYEKAGEIALSICVEEDKQGTIKRSGVPLTQGSSPLSNLLEYCLLRPGHLLAETGYLFCFISQKIFQKKFNLLS